MVLERRPFEPQSLEGEREGKGRVLSIRFNEEELKALTDFMDLVDTTNEGRAIKLLMRAGLNVLQADLGPVLIKWLARRDRARVVGAND
jgi:hypothetical protein